MASISQAQLEEVVQAARSHGDAAAIVESCQRVEVFHHQACHCGAPASWNGFEALVRMAEVAAGLHSVALGEDQILGQVRTGLATAGPRVAELGSLAVAAARALRSEEAFSAHTGHLLDRALALAETPVQGRLAVVGGGAVAGLVVRRAVELGFSDIRVIARRQPDNAWFDASWMKYVPFADLATVDGVDVLVTCLGSAAAPLEAEHLPAVSRLVVDLGTPRNVAGILTCCQITIADMLAEPAARPHSDARRAALRARLREILERRLEMVTTDGRSQLGRLRLEIERIRRDEAVRIGRLHPELSPQAVEAITRSLVNQIFHRPTERLRTADPVLGARLVDLFVADPRSEVEANS